ncbi:MAG: PD40 domain-containing protein [Chloroflexi bacterium]|nr:PD40 domain-containing protein [Chloroflexota bacterium]
MNGIRVPLALLGVALMLAISCASPELPTAISSTPANIPATLPEPTISANQTNQSPYLKENSPSATVVLPVTTTFSKNGRITMRYGDGETIFLTSGPADLVPSVSPDGTKVAFVRIAPDETAGTYVVNADGTDEHRVAPSTTILSRPAWSPDSNNLAFRDIAQERMGVWTVDADGANLRRIFQGNPLPPVWSPDGESIAFANGVSTKDGSVAIGLYVTDPLGNKPKLVAEGRYGETAWSPDGKRLAVVASPKDAPRALLTMDVASGKNIASVGNVAEGAWSPVWAPDGKDIALILAKENRQHLALVSSSGSIPKILVSGKTIGTPVWSADGRYLTMAMDEDGTRGFEIIRLGADGSSALQKLGTGEAPCSTPGSVTRSTKVVAAESPLEGMRRADLFLMSGGWT